MTLPNMAEMILKQYESEIRVYISRSIHASGIGGACERALVYDQVAETRQKNDPTTELLFSMGRYLEDKMYSDMVAATKGNEEVQIIRERLPIPPNKHNIGGQLDFSIAVKDGKEWKKFPLEGKTCSDFVFNRLFTYQDMIDDQSQYIRKWPAQLQIYMLMTNTEQGAFLLMNRNTGAYRQINVTLDYAYAEQLLQRAERINKSIEAYKIAVTPIEQDKALPERIPFSGEICMKCSHRTNCCPDIALLAGVENRLWDAELNAYCHIREQNEAAKEAYNEADDKIKAHCKSIAQEIDGKGNKTILLDNYTITVKKSVVKRTEVPDEIKKQYGIPKESVMVRTEIEQIKK